VAPVFDCRFIDHLLTLNFNALKNTHSDGKVKGNGRIQR
tara:strand:+ start:436 stop:552 length:117 start_codon:yes stop_codon:yes gene_type:complete